MTHLWALLLLSACGQDPKSPDSPPETDGTGTETTDPGDDSAVDTGTATDDTADTDETTEPAPPAASGLRRLSNRELANTLQAAAGVAPEDALSRLMPDLVDYGFDRVAESQTISLVHLEAFEEVASAVAEALIDGALLDELTGSCPDVILPPWTSTVAAVVPSTSLAGEPDWSLLVRDDYISFLYSDTVTVSGTFSAPAPGLYRFSFPINVYNTREFPDITFSVDGEEARTWSAVTGVTTLETEVEVASSGSVFFSYDFYPGDRWWSESLLDLFDLTIEGPLDTGADVYTAERDACARSLAATLAERAWRRPPTEAELARLEGVWEAGVTLGTEADGLRMVIEAILQSPWFLYLVEVGEPDPERPDWYRLTDNELAARLSYALCESPPDDTLRAAADAGELADPEQLEEHARRLLEAPCGRETVARFHRQWLELDKLDSLARDPNYFPDFTPELGPAMRAETEHYLDRMVFDEGAGIEALWGSSVTWVGPETAWLYGLSVDEEAAEVTMPPERAGLLNQPALLAVTGKFAETSPVLRGVYVLERLVCEHLESPPSGLDITPPEMNDEMTTRERWEAHSSDPACSGCHDRIDPVGFALEGFDALGVYRTEENGLPVDTSGGFPDLGIEALANGRELSEALAASDALRGCFARHWSRYGLGRLEDTAADAASLGAMTEASEYSVYEALVSLVLDEGFRYRIAREESP